MHVEALPSKLPPPTGTRDLAEIYAEHFDAVWNHLRRMGIADADRDDLAQEVFLVVHRRLDAYDQARPMRPWLIGICTRVVLRHWRTTRRRPADHAAASPAAELARVATNDPDHAARELLAALLATIDPEPRAMFVLHELEGFSVPEIAHATEVPVNTVYSRLRRTREELAERARTWHDKEAR
jgi:RNA polymerase sigma-70 factor (ECF subfamily)